MAVKGEGEVGRKLPQALWGHRRALCIMLLLPRDG